MGYVCLRARVFLSPRPPVQRGWGDDRSRALRPVYNPHREGEKTITHLFNSGPQNRCMNDSFKIVSTVCDVRIVADPPPRSLSMATPLIPLMDVIVRISRQTPLSRVSSGIRRLQHQRLEGSKMRFWTPKNVILGSILTFSKNVPNDSQRYLNT